MGPLFIKLPGCIKDLVGTPLHKTTWLYGGPSWDPLHKNLPDRMENLVGTPLHKNLPDCKEGLVGTLLHKEQKSSYYLSHTLKKHL